MAILCLNYPSNMNELKNTFWNVDGCSPLYASRVTGMLRARQLLRHLLRIEEKYRPVPYAFFEKYGHDGRKIELACPVSGANCPACREVSAGDCFTQRLRTDVSSAITVIEAYKAIDRHLKSVEKHQPVLYQECNAHPLTISKYAEQLLMARIAPCL